MAGLNKLKEKPASDEFKAVVDMLRIGAKVMPDTEEGLSRGEIQQMLSASGGAPGGPQQGGAPPGPLGMVGAGRPRPNVMAGPPMGGMR